MSHFHIEPYGSTHSRRDISAVHGDYYGYVWETKNLECSLMIMKTTHAKTDEQVTHPLYFYILNTYMVKPQKIRPSE